MKTIIKIKSFTLRPFRMSDARAIAQNINDREIARNLLTVPHPYKIRDARKHLRLTLKHDRKRKRTRYSFALDMGGEVIGSISLFKTRDHRAEIGYWLTRRFWGQGIMTRAVKKVTAFAFRDLGLHRVYAHVFYFNKASMRVLRKAGYVKEGILRKHEKKGSRHIDSYLFAKVR
jgi:RimJ/RimL family protein N-acetyltransferase